MGEVLIKVEDVSKKFAKDLKKSLLYGLSDVFSGVTRKKQDKSLRKDEFWAVKGISFEVHRGECLGLIGHNGAGKSTLLKILNGLIAPDEGSVTMYGKVGALIELGAGFNPILTGRENIYNNGAIIGFSKREIEAKFDAIVAFSELEEFIDMPVQNYSSGMKVRLGFAIASQMEPDVLIIDEVLAVGDLGFVLKCFKRIDTILPNTAIVFVSHSMPMVSRICSQIILMQHGKPQLQGKEVGKAIDLYYTHFSDNESNVVFDDGSLELENVELLSYQNIVNEFPQLNWKDDFKLKFIFKNINLLDFPVFTVSLFDKEQKPLAILRSNEPLDSIVFNDEKIEFIVEHKELQLSKGIYSVNISVHSLKTKEPLLRINSILNFQVIHEMEIWPPFLLDSKYLSL